MTLSPDVIACAQLVERADPDRFAATMAAPVSVRAVLFPLYAMNVEVSRAPWVTQETMIAEMRLQWWRDAVAEIAAGGAVRPHEVVTPLARAIPAELAPVLDELVAVRRWDIYKEPFEDQAHFDAYLNASAAGLIWLAARALGPADETVVRDYGYAVGVAAWLRAVPELEARGRIPLLDGTPQGVRNLAQAGLDRLTRARRNRPAVSKFARCALLAGWQTEALLSQAVKEPGRVARGALATSPARARTSLIWQRVTGRF